MHQRRRWQQADGREQWRKDLVKDFAGQRGGWGYSESPLVDGDKLLVTPGGKKASVEIPGPTPKADPKKVEIKTGISDGLNVEVLSGLKKGDKVIERPPKEIS